MASSYSPGSVHPKLDRPLEFGDYRARLMRYELFWAFYNALQYSEAVNAMADRYKYAEKLYRNIRAVFSVGFRLGEFWATHLLGGPLDFAAGDGVTVPTALPILAESDAVRSGIARLWRDSQWVVEKDSLARQGSIKGDAFIEVVPRFDRRRLVMRSINPEKVTDLEKDGEGRVVGCTIWDERRDPDQADIAHGHRRKVDYQRTMSIRDDGRLDVYTYRGREPYNWGEGPTGSESAWTLEQGFVPLYHIEHRDLGFDFGGSELAGVLGKIAETDGVGSNLIDWTIRALNGPRMISGLKAADVRLDLDDRTKMGLYFAQSKDARVQTMLDPMPVGEVTALSAMLLEEILHDHPELAIDKQRASGDMSGKSLREGRKPAETRVKSRRAGYDARMVRAQRDALWMGGELGFPGYEAFSGLDPDDPALDHQIADRDVFLLDPFDRLEEQTGRFTMAQAARAAGLTIEDALARAGVPPEEAARARAEMQRMELLTIMMNAPAAPAGDPAAEGAAAQFTTPPDATQVPTRSTA